MDDLRAFQMAALHCGLKAKCAHVTIADRQDLRRKALAAGSPHVEQSIEFDALVGSDPAVAGAQLLRHVSATLPPEHSWQDRRDIAGD